MIDFDGKCAIVTGAARGQGQAEAELFASLGARVIVADIDLESAEAVARAIGPQARAFRLDVASEDDWARLLDRAIQWSGGVDILVNNAAVFRRASLLGALMDDVRTMVSVNLMGAYLGIRTVGAHLLTRGCGAIVNVASVGALSPGENSTLYGMTKGAVVTLTRGAAVELAPTVRVNCILPGGVDTRMLSEAQAPFFDNIPLARPGKPSEIANAVAFLASSAASYITGASLAVDGGWRLGESALKFQRLRDAALAARPS